MMIKRFSEWESINEVDELTEVKLYGKYINNIIQAYQKHPDSRPCRNPENFVNAKDVQPLSTFVKGVSGRTSAEIVTAVINDWYKWPDESESKKVIMRYINNDDDLSNLAAFGVPFGKVLLSDPSILAGMGKIGTSLLKKTGTAVSSASKSKLFSWVPKLFGIRESNTRINEGAILGLAASFVFGTLLSAATRYSLYGKESLQDDPLVSWTTPYLPDIKGMVGDDPTIVTYVSVFNTMMMIVYDSWNLCMGQDKYGTADNPIISWQNSDNYINAYYKQFYESDADIKSNFVAFMNDLRQACLNDMKHPSIFEKTPFYYTGDKIRVNFEGGETESIKLSDWYKWVKDNYKKYVLVPVSGSKTEFIATPRKGDFTPLAPLGINEPAKGDPMRLITFQFPDGSIATPSLLELDVYLANTKNIGDYAIEKQDIINGGSSLILQYKEDADIDKDKTPDVETKNPAVIKGSNIEEIAMNIQKEDLDSFIGMGNI